MTKSFATRGLRSIIIEIISRLKVSLATAPRAFCPLNEITIKEHCSMLPDNGAFCQWEALNHDEKTCKLHDLTAVLIALEIIDSIADPVGRYQALRTIATGFGIDYAHLSHLYALYCAGV